MKGREENMIGKLLRTLLALLIVVSSFSGMGATAVHAEENEEIPYSEDPIDIITELGNSYDVFPQTKPRMMLMSGESTTIGDRMGMIYIDNQFGYDYLSYLYVGGKTVFCIEPMMLFSEGVEYTENYTKWDDLSESQRQAIWEINYYGYSYPGHQTDAYYIATQLMIWEVVDRWYDPYYTDGTTYYDVSAEINEINSLRSNPQGRPSFNNTTVKAAINVPVTLTDSKGVLPNYNIHNGKGVNLSANGNNLTVTLTSTDFDSSMTFSNKYEARDVNIIYGAPGYQNTIYLATRVDPTGSFKLNFELLKGKIEIEKRDAETGTAAQGDSTFNGATFELKDSKGNLLETLTTNGAKVSSKEYPYGTTLYLSEKNPPSGYLKSNETIEIKIDSVNGETPAVFPVVYKDNVIKGKLHIQKSIETPIGTDKGQQFVFDIYLKSSNKLVETITTNKNGEATSGLLPYGTYVVKEHQKPGFILAEDYEIVIDENEETIEYTLLNEAEKISIQMIKLDEETGETPQGDAKLSGGKFDLYYNDTLLETLTTDEEGKATTAKEYPVGYTYVLKENTAPEGYIVSSASTNVKVEIGDTEKIVRLTDKVIKGKIEIAKSVSDKDHESTTIQVPGVNFIFDIYLKSSNELVTTLTTDEDGRAISGDLPYGVYIVKERPMESYVTLPQFEVNISEDSKIYFYNIFNDKFRAEIEIYKTDSETGKKIPAAGVEFKIKDSEGNFVKHTVTYPQKYETDVFTTDETGSVHLPEPLEYGDYFITEISAPYGYVLSGDMIPLPVDGTAAEIFISFPNKAQKGQIVIEKYGEMLTGAGVVDSEYGDLYDAIYEEKYLDGVTFEVRAAEDIIGEEGTLWYSKGDLVDTIVTNSTGDAKSKEIPLGKYIVKETATKPGFVLDEEEYEVTLEYAGQEVEVTSEQITVINDRQKLDLQVTKLFEEDDPAAYKDVLFGVYNVEDITLGEEVIIPADSLMGLTGIDENGKNTAQFDLPVGNYYLKELKTNVGFVLDEEQHPFTFEYVEDSTMATVTVKLDDITNDKRRLTLEVNKVDKDNHDVFLNGAVFEVKDSTTGDDLGILVSGRLAVKGDAADEEYEISDTEDFSKILKTAKTDSHKELIVEMPEGTYFVRKKAEAIVSDDPVTPETADAETETVPAEDSGYFICIVKDGNAVLPNAVYGHKYEFKEIEAPKSYNLSDALMSYEAVNEAGEDVVVYIFENKRIEVPNTGIR